MNQQWTCPYCDRDCTIDDTDMRDLDTSKYISNEYGYYRSFLRIIVCPNPKCRNQTINLDVRKTDASGRSWGDKVYNWQLKPESEAKPFPDYIPIQLRNDYKEACLIKTKSPKASATLSRRCLQGMIRDFWKIKKGRLIDEIDALEEKVDPVTWAAINSVREVGNIGAHMEKDVNLIIDVDQEEAGLLIWLIETLFKEWYIAKHDKEQRMHAIVKLAQDKKDKKQKAETGVKEEGKKGESATKLQS